LVGTTLQSYKLNLPNLVAGAQLEVLEPSDAGPIQQDAVLYRARAAGDGNPFTGADYNATFTVDVAFDSATPAVGGRLVFTALKAAADRTAHVLTRIIQEVFDE
jgi:hypothetical protein